MDNQNNNNSRYHIHNVLKENQILESIFRFKKIYCYLPRKKSFISKNRPRKLTAIGLLCLYCGHIKFNQDYKQFQQHLTDQV